MSSHDLPVRGSKPPSSARVNQQRSDVTPHIGQLAPKGSIFCPLSALTKWPYKFLQHQDSELISRAFFAGGKLRTRGWTIYYIHTLLDASNKHLILVPAEEVQALFDDVKKTLGLRVHFPSTEKEPGFRLSFTDEGIPRPRYLGRLGLDNSLNDLEAEMPPHSYTEYDENILLDDRSFTAFKKMMEAAIQATKQKSKAQKDRKKNERIATRQSWCEQLKRTQCYLGIRPKVDYSMQNPLGDPGIPPRELEAAVKKFEQARCINLPELNLTSPAPYECQDHVVFVCVDVEAYEKDSRAVTEIGVSTLDTNDLAGLAPGEGGSAWMKKIRSRHFRIRETAHLTNSQFVAGCADKFEKQFGASEWISVKEVPQIIASCFRPPFSNLNVDGSSPHNPGDATQRKIMLVGHAVRMDIDYLRKLGYDVSNLSNLIEAIDTADLYRAWMHEHNPTNLGAVLLTLELVGWNLHNAGNDAAYTLQALIGICIAALKSPSQRQITHETLNTARIEEQEREARVRATEDADEWAAADVEGGDGGPPKRLEKHGFGWEVSKSFDSSPTKNSKERRSERLATQKVEEKKGEAIQTARAENGGANGDAKRRKVETEWPPLEITSEPWVAEEVGSEADGSKTGNGLHGGKVDSEANAKKVEGGANGGKVDNGEGSNRVDGGNGAGGNGADGGNMVKVGDFAQSMADRLAFLEEGEEEVGGVKLPKT